MRCHVIARVFVPLVAVLLFASSQSAAQAQAPELGRRLPIIAPALTLPIVGTTPGVGTAPGGTFSGTLSIQRFAARNGQVVALGFVRGTLMNANGEFVGSVLNGAVAMPVTVSEGGTTAPAPINPTAPSGATSSRSDFILVQDPGTCGVLHLDIQPINLDVLGQTVTTSPITIDIAEEPGATNVIGTLVCQILAALTNVANVVGLLNLLLGALGFLGGLAV